MKTIYNKIFAALAFAALLCPTACVEEAPEYTKADAVGNAEVYFPNDLETSYNLKDYDGNITIDVKRVDASEQLTVPLTTSADAIFSVPSSVTFSAGSTDAKISFTYDISKVEAEKEYPVSITLGDQTTPYGVSKYDFVVSVPAAWIKYSDPDNSAVTGKVHVYETWWGEDETETMYYQDLGNDVWYCYIENCWDTAGGATAQNYYFYWDKKTNYLSIPMQYMGYTASAGKVYASDAEAFYTAYYGAEWLAGKGGAAWLYNALGETRPYYDGNGAFYLASYYAFGPESEKFGSGYSFGSDVDYAIAEGYNRVTDYNDKKHIGASSPLYDGTAASQFFSEDDALTPYEFETQMRYDAAYLEKVDSIVPEGTTTTYYLKDYFGEGHSLAFTAPAPELLVNGSEISDVANEQETGVSVFGNPLYVTVKKGEFTFEEGNEFPTASITLKVYTKNADGETVFDFDQVVETFTASDYAKDNYTIEDIYGGYLKDYLGTWTIASYDYFDQCDYAYDITLSDAGQDEEGQQLVKISNLTGYSKYFDDSIYAIFTNYALYVYPQYADGTYSESNVYMYTFDPDSEKMYNAYPVLGGICTDGNLAFVSQYSNVNLSGFAFYLTEAKQYVSIISNVRGLIEESESAQATSCHVMLQPQQNHFKPFASISSAKSAKIGSANRVVLTKKSDSSKSFSLSPVEKVSRDLTEKAFVPVI
jgi:hypothetical protein